MLVDGAWWMLGGCVLVNGAGGRREGRCRELVLVGWVLVGGDCWVGCVLLGQWCVAQVTWWGGGRADWFGRWVLAAG